MMSVANNLGAVGCGHIQDASIKCCVPNAEVIAPGGGSTTTGIPCNYGGNDGTPCVCNGSIDAFCHPPGTCIATEQCAMPKRPFPSSAGASGCNSIKDANIQCW